MFVARASLAGSRALPVTLRVRMTVKRRRQGPDKHTGSQPSFDAQFDEVFGARPDKHTAKRRGLLACGGVVLIIVAAVLFAGT